MTDEPLDLDAIQARRMNAMRAALVAVRALPERGMIQQGCVISAVAQVRDDLRKTLTEDVPALVAEVKRLCERETRVRALHFERKGVCWECPQHDWPCLTAQAFDGEATA